MTQPVTTVQIDRISSNLVGLLHFNENTGSTAYDETSNNNDGTLANGATWATGKFGSCVNFPSASDIVTISDSASIDVDYITIMAWAKVDFGNFGINGSLAVRDNNTSIRFFEFFRRTSDNILFAVWDVDGTVKTKVFAPIDAVWHHVAMTWDGAYLRVYINGAEHAPATVGTNKTLKKGTRDIHIGDFAGASGGEYRGLVDEFAIYDRALSAAEISHLYYKQPILLF